MSLQRAQAFGRLMGHLLYSFDSETARVTRRNIDLCFADKPVEIRRQLIKDSLQQISMTFSELGAIWEWPADKSLALIKHVSGEDLLNDLVSGDRPVVILAPHYGNWELLGLFLAKKFQVASLYSPPKQAGLETYIRAARERSGSLLVPASQKGVVQLLGFLRKGGATGILPDQEPDLSSGKFAPFFGQPALTMTLASRLIQKTGARACVAVAHRLPSGQGFELRFREVDSEIYEKDLSASVAAMNRSIEKVIQEDPRQYQWAYKRFRKQPDGGKGFYKRLPTSHLN